MKICGLRTSNDVAVAIDAGADAVGFVFAKSVRQITPGEAAAISMSVPANVRRVAVMLHPSDAEWQAVLSTFEPDVLQTDAEDFAGLHVPDSVERWPVFREGGEPPDTQGCFVYEGPKSGHGQPVDWSAAAQLARDRKMILAGGLSAGNVATAIDTVSPYGVDVSSAVESSPGRKDAGMIRKFVSAARAAERKV